MARREGPKMKGGIQLPMFEVEPEPATVAGPARQAAAEWAEAHGLKLQTGPHGSAVLSPCGTYRYRLDRSWNKDVCAPMVWVMLNPSTADADEDDSTLRRVTAFSKKAGCGGLVVVNLFAPSGRRTPNSYARTPTRSARATRPRSGRHRRRRPYRGRVGRRHPRRARRAGPRRHRPVDRPRPPPGVLGPHRQGPPPAPAVRAGRHPPDRVRPAVANWRPAPQGGESVSKKEDEFNPWQWDRKNAMATRSRLVVERHGHEVTLDHKGVSIDGERIVQDNPGRGGHDFQVTTTGLVMYRGREVAAIDPSRRAPPTRAR